jgi:hypothetical protein
MIVVESGEYASVWRAWRALCDEVCGQAAALAVRLWRKAAEMRRKCLRGLAGTIPG